MNRQFTHQPQSAFNPDSRIASRAAPPRAHEYDCWTVARQDAPPCEHRFQYQPGGLFGKT